MFICSFSFGTIHGTKYTTLLRHAYTVKSVTLCNTTELVHPVFLLRFNCIVMIFVVFIYIAQCVTQTPKNAVTILIEFKIKQWDMICLLFYSRILALTCLHYD